MVNEVADAIKKVSIAVLEDWAFMNVDPLEGSGDIFNKKSSYYIANVRFKGIINGSYSVICQEEFIDNLVDNILANDAQGSEAEKLDALRELANVLSGNLITESYGSDVTFDLRYPLVSLGDSRAAEELISERTFWVLADDQPVAITFSLESQHDH